MPTNNKTTAKAKDIAKEVKEATEAAVKEVPENIKEFSGIVKENYLNGLEYTFSLWEQNFKAINSHVAQVLDMEKEFVTNVNEYYKDLPSELPFSGAKKVDIADQFDKYIDFRKEQAETVKSVTEKFAKDARTQAEANVEKAFQIFGDYLNMIKV